MSTTSVIAAWREAFVGLEQSCPWAGPRPLSQGLDAGASYRFVPREDESEQLLELIRANSLVVFHGESGAGKSSLLDMSLLDELYRRGFLALPWRSWGMLGDDDPEAFLTQQFRASGLLHETVIEQLDAGRSLVEVLDEAYGEQALILLDQFEELIRDRKQDGFNRVVEWILGVNRSSRTRIVLSLRSEYAHRLAGLMREARPFTTAYFELRAMTGPEDVRAIVESGNGRGTPAIDPEAADLVISHWAMLAEEGRRQPSLGVQACLYALHRMAADRTPPGESVVVSLEDVETLEAQASAADVESPDPVDLFTFSFDRTIEGRLGHCMEACHRLADVIPPTLRHLARSSVVEASAHLSSGGYKLERELGDLFVRSREREFRLAGWSVEQGRAAAEELLRATDATSGIDALDPLTASRKDVAARLGIPLPHLTQVEAGQAAAEVIGIRPLPWVTDPDDVSAGVLLGYPVEDLLIEQLRAFVFAIRWLEAAALVKIMSTDEVILISLVHDGFGAPLEDWAARVGLEPWAAVHGIVAYEGRRFDWRGHAGEPFENPPGSMRYLANLRWRHCRLTRATFRRVVFVNCDFRGTVWDHCLFEGVTFVNCLLDGASLEWCQIIGGVDVTPGDAEGPDAAAQTKVAEQSDTLFQPDFVLAGQDVAPVVTELQWYRRGEFKADCLYSPTSGVAAVPWRTGLSDSVPWREQQTGLVMYGGRLSSLMVKDCSFSPDGAGDPGALALCFMAGSSLDFVEQGGGDVLLYYSVVRGLAVTDRVELDARARGVFRLGAVGCKLTHAFFGAGISGMVHVRDSVVLGISNASEDLDVLVDDCKVAGGDNVRFHGNNLLPEFGAGRPSHLVQDILASTTSRMAYRSVPARVEVETRLQQGH